MVKLNLKDFNTAPQELIDRIESLKVRDEIADNWGTRYCRKLLDELIADTRDNTRKGFPETIASTLIELAVLHEMKMEDLGYGDFSDSAFMAQPDKWKLPKNF